MKMVIISGRSEEGVLVSSIHFKVYTFFPVSLTYTHRNRGAWEASRGKLYLLHFPNLLQFSKICLVVRLYDFISAWKI